MRGLTGHLELTPHEREEALAYLVSRAWEIQQRFTASTESTFSPRALDQLALLELAIETDSSPTAVARELGVSPALYMLRAEAVVTGADVRDPD